MGQGASFCERPAERVVVERLVGDQGVDEEAAKQRIDADAVMTLAGQEHEASEVAERVDQRQDLGGQATRSAAARTALAAGQPERGA